MVMNVKADEVRQLAKMQTYLIAVSSLIRETTLKMMKYSGQMHLKIDNVLGDRTPKTAYHIFLNQAKVRLEKNFFLQHLVL